MQRNSKKIKKETANNTIVSHPFDCNELRHELYMRLPAITTGKLGLLSHQWQLITLYEKIDAKKLVLQLIYAKARPETDDSLGEYDQLTQTLFRKNKAILELKTKETNNPWEKLLAHLVFKKPMEAEIIIRLLPELELDQIIKLGYTLDFQLFSCENMWKNIILLLFSANYPRNDKTTIAKIESTIVGLKEIANDHLANLIIESLLPIIYALKQDWGSFIKTQNTTLYRNLPHINFGNAHLENINLCRSDLNYSNFKKANIKYGLFIHTFCYYVNFKEVLAEGSKFIGANLYHIYAENANFSKSDLTGASMIGANFKDAFLSEALMMNVIARGAIFENTSLREANLSHAKLDRAQMSKAYLAGAILDGASICGADLSECILTNVSCHKTLFFGTKPPDDTREYLRKNGAYLTLSDFIRSADDNEISGRLFAENLRNYIDIYIKLIITPNGIPSPNYDTIINTIKQYKNDDATIKTMGEWLFNNRIRTRFQKLKFPLKSYYLIKEIHEAYVHLEKRREILLDGMDVEHAPTL